METPETVNPGDVWVTMQNKFLDVLQKQYWAGWRAALVKMRDELGEARVPIDDQAMRWISNRIDILLTIADTDTEVVNARTSRGSHDRMGGKARSDENDHASS